MLQLYSEHKKENKMTQNRVKIKRLIEKCLRNIWMVPKETVNMIMDHLDPETKDKGQNYQATLLMSASCLAIGEMARNGPLPLENEGPRSKQSLFKWLLDTVKSSKVSIKIRER